MLRKLRLRGRTQNTQNWKVRDWPRWEENPILLFPNSLLLLFSPLKHHWLISNFDRLQVLSFESHFRPCLSVDFRDLPVFTAVRSVWGAPEPSFPVCTTVFCPRLSPLPLPPSSALLTCARSHTVHAGGVFAVLAQSPVTLPEGLSGFTAVASCALTPNSKRESHRQKGQRKEEGTNHRSSQGTPRGEDKI